MLISILTPSFNSAATIQHTLDAVAVQSYRNKEHLIIDGGSTDQTVEILSHSSFGGRYITEPDKGIYDAMNKGIRLAQGEIIGILNADDFYPHPRVLEKVMQAFTDQDCDAVYGDLHYVDAADTDRIVRYWRSGSYTPNAFTWGWMPPHPTFFVRRSVYEKYGLFNLDLGTAADYELMLRFIHRHRISLAYIPEVLVNMRTGGASNSNLTARLKANRMDRKAWEVNGLEPYWFTTYLKPLRKLTQFVFK